MTSTLEPNDPPINTDEGILAYLTRATARRYISVERLSGGNSNHLWRVVAAPSDSNAADAQTTSPEKASKEASLQAQTQNTSEAVMIIKHAEPFPRFNPSLSLPTERMDFEARALRLIPRIMQDKGHHPPDSPTKAAQPDSGAFGIHVPRVYAHYPSASVLAMSDGGPRNLKAAYASLSTPQVRSVGARLGRWLARLHARSRDLDIGAGGHAMARSIYRYSYQHVASALEHYHGMGERGRELGKAVDEKFGALLGSDDECVAHGDFWPGNMLVGSPALQQGQGEEGAAAAAEEEETEAEVPITIVDWEIVRRGVGVTDVAQFAAEAYLLDSFRPIDHGLAGAFVRSYLAELATPPSGVFWQRFAAHWGVHIAYWPTRVEWADAEETRKFGRLGVEAMERAMAMEVGGDGKAEAEHGGVVEFLLGCFDDARRDLS